MNQYAVLTAVGEDRSGLVNAVSKFILQCGCNIEDSRMALLGGEFAMVILVAGAQESIDRLLAEAEGLGQKLGLMVHGRRTRVATEARSRAIPYEVTAYSMDHPGIVERVTHFLAEHKVNIRALDTRVSNAPHTGQPLFSLHASIDVPAGENVAELRRGLAVIGAEQNIDIVVKPAH